MAVVIEVVDKPFRNITGLFSGGHVKKVLRPAGGSLYLNEVFA